MAEFFAVLFLFAAILAYFIPVIVAHNRHKANFSAILALNLLRGWTLIGWVCALVWALTVDRPEVTYGPQR